MNSRLLNRLLIGLCLLLLGWTVLGAIVLVRYRATPASVDAADLDVKDHDRGQESGDSLGPLEEYSFIFETRNSLLSAVSTPLPMPEPNWKAIRLLQTVKFRGKWEAIVEYPVSRRGRVQQDIVWVGRTLRISLARPAIVKGRTRVATTTVTVSAIGANSITFTDTEGRRHRTDL